MSNENGLQSGRCYLDNTSHTSMLKCTCGNRGNEEFVRYHYEDNFTGYRCKRENCNKEWLIDKGDDEGVRGRMLNIERDVKVILHRKGYSSAHGRTRFRNLKEARFYLKAGDHICWRRRLGYWHHAIVKNVRGKAITVIQFAPHGCSVKVRECIIQASSSEEKENEGIIKRCLKDCFSRKKSKVERGTLYRVDYQDDQADPPALVVARAMSFIDEQNYRVFRNNCEHFVTFCKTGNAKSFQIGRTFSKVKEAFTFVAMRTLLVSVVFFFLAETLENLHSCKEIAKPFNSDSFISVGTNASCNFFFCEKCTFIQNIIGMVIIICLESVRTCSRIYINYSRFKKGFWSRLDFISSLLEQITEGLLVTVLVVGLSFLPEEPDKWIFARIFGLLLGVPIFKYVGVQLGRVCGACVVSTTKYDDTRVLNPIIKLDAGDIIFLNPKKVCIPTTGPMYAVVYNGDETSVLVDETQEENEGIQQESISNLNYLFKKKTGTIVSKNLDCLDFKSAVYRVMIPSFPLTSCTFNEIMTAAESVKSKKVGIFQNESKRFAFSIRESLLHRDETDMSEGITGSYDNLELIQIT